MIDNLFVSFAFVNKKFSVTHQHYSMCRSYHNACCVVAKAAKKWWWCGRLSNQWALVCP